MTFKPVQFIPKSFFWCAVVPLLVFASPGLGQENGGLDLANYCTKIRPGNRVEISLYTPAMFRVRVSYLKGEIFPPRYEIPFLIGKLSSWDPVDYRQWNDTEYHYIETDILRIRLSMKDRSWDVWSKGGEKQIFPSEGKIYGMFRDGYTVFDNASAFDERNNNNRYSHWFYNPSSGRYVDTYLHEDLIFDRYFINGPDYPALFWQLNELTGPEPLLPLKGYGFFQTQHLGCAGSQEQLIQLAAELRERDLPCDNLIIDFEWGDGCPGEEEKFWGQLDWSPAYEHPLTPGQMIARLDSMNFNVMLIHHSAPDFPNRALNTPRRIREWTSRVYPEDFWWQKLFEKMEIGIAGTWQDTRQNDITDGVIWTGIQDHIGPGNRVYFMGCRKMMDLNPWEVERDNTIPANNLIGARRYPFRWPGDVDNTYRELKWQINAITNTHGSMKGVSYITADCFGKDWKVQARWNQFIDFNSVSRSHTSKPWQNIMDYPQPTAENSIRRHRQVRYRLLPYIYSTAFMNYLTGMPVCRPMLLAFPGDLRVNRDQWPYQYMFGENLLVAPVYADLNSMEIYLPEGFQWIDYWDKTVYEGGQSIDYNTSDVEKLPLFIRSGAIIPMRQDRNWIETGEIWDTLIIDIYPGDSASAFTLYEDDKVTTLYQRGEFTKTLMECHPSRDGIEIRVGKSTGTCEGVPRERMCVFQVNHMDGCPSGINHRDGPLIQRMSQSELNMKSSGWYFDELQNLILVKLNLATAEGDTIRIYEEKRGQITS